MDVESENVGAGLGERGEVVMKLLGVLVEGGRDEGAELFFERNRAGATEGDGEDVGGHLLARKSRRRRRRLVVCCSLSPIFEFGAIDVNTKIFVTQKTSTSHHQKLTREQLRAMNRMSQDPWLRLDSKINPFMNPERSYSRIPSG